MKKKIIIILIVILAVIGIVISNYKYKKSFLCQGKQQWVYVSKDLKYELGKEFIDISIPITLTYKFYPDEDLKQIQSVSFDFEEIENNRIKDSLFYEENGNINVTKFNDAANQGLAYMFQLNVDTGAFKQSDTMNFKDRDAWISSDGVCKIFD